MNTKYLKHEQKKWVVDFILKLRIEKENKLPYRKTQCKHYRTSGKVPQ